MEEISLTNPLFKTYFFYISVLALKMLMMSILTGKTRIQKGAFVNPEDAIASKGKIRTDDDVERLRRAHLNDLENIPLFMIMSGLYIMTGPCPWLTTMMLRTYTGTRLLHTVVYALVPMPQPARALSWGLGYGITIYMAVNILIKFMSAM